MTIRKVISELLRFAGNVHVQATKPDIFLLSTPRSGSTWVMEIIASERYIRPCNEPFNIRIQDVARKLQIDDWESLAEARSLPKIEQYLKNLQTKKYGYAFRSPRPFSTAHQYFTNRTVFKILFALEDKVEWIRNTFKAKIIGLVRHPIPVSLSRECHPRLPALLTSDIAKSLTPDQQRNAAAIFKHGSHLERAQLDWCLQNLPLLREPEKLDLLITYEQLVIQPDVVVDRLANILELESTRRLSDAIRTISASVSKSSETNRDLLMKNKRGGFPLLTKWHQEVSAFEEQNLMRVLSDLGLEAYETGNVLPSKSLWIGNDYPGTNSQRTPA